MHRRMHPCHHSNAVIKTLITAHTMPQKVAEQQLIRQGQDQERI